MPKACPINHTTIDATTTRLCSLISTAILGVFMLSGSIGVVVLLIVDLLVRLYGNRSYSLIALAADYFKRFFNLRPQPIDGAVKHIVGHFGLVFLTLLLVSHALGAIAVMYAVAVVYGACMLLDGVTGYCVGCTVYRLYAQLIGR